MSHTVGKEAFEEAMKHIVDFVYQLRMAKASIKSVDAHYASFCYLLTQKQQDAIKNICLKEGWDIPHCKGVEINVSTIDHILSSRMGDRGVTPEFITALLLASYNQFSEVYLNKKNGEQAVILNSIKKLPLNNTVWYAVAIVSLDARIGGVKRLKSVTAYHADDKKIRGIKKG